VGEGKTRSLHVAYVLAEVPAGFDAWHRFQAIAHEFADRNRAALWNTARRRADIR
jgi:hypothetical protein